MGRRQDKTRERLRILITRMIDDLVPVSKELEQVFKQFNYDVEEIVETLMRNAERERKLIEKRKQAETAKIFYDEFLLSKGDKDENN